MTSKPTRNSKSIGSAYPWQDAYSALQRSLEEEADMLRKAVNNPDTCCAARELRRARLSGIEHAMAVADNLSRWEWGC